MDKCIKCGKATANLNFHKSEDDCAYSDINRRKSEHLHYYCKCGYDWTTQTEEQRHRQAAERVKT